MIHELSRLPAKKLSYVIVIFIVWGCRISIDNLPLNSKFSKYTIFLRKEPFYKYSTCLMKSHNALYVEEFIQLLLSFLKLMFLFAGLTGQEFQYKDLEDGYIRQVVFLQARGDIVYVSLVDLILYYLCLRAGLVRIDCKKSVHNCTVKVTFIVIIYEKTDQDDKSFMDSRYITNHIKQGVYFSFVELFLSWKFNTHLKYRREISIVGILSIHFQKIDCVIATCPFSKNAIFKFCSCFR